MHLKANSYIKEKKSCIRNVEQRFPTTNEHTYFSISYLTPTHTHVHIQADPIDPSWLIFASLLGRGSGRVRRDGGCGGGCGSSGSGGGSGSGSRGRGGTGGLMHGARVLHEIALCGRAKVALRALKRAFGTVHGELCGCKH